MNRVYVTVVFRSHASTWPITHARNKSYQFSSEFRWGCREQPACPVPFPLQLQTQVTLESHRDSHFIWVSYRAIMVIVQILHLPLRSLIRVSWWLGSGLPSSMIWHALTPMAPLLNRCFQGFLLYWHYRHCYSLWSLGFDQRMVCC